MIPLCHKCSEAITEWNIDGDIVFHSFIGCHKCKEIRDSKDAKEKCPLINKGT